VSGVMASVTPYIVAGESEGYEVVISPTGTSGVAVVITHLDPHEGADPPSVGSAVTAGSTVLGRIRDFSSVGPQQMALYPAAAGAGTSARQARDLLDAGVDVLTGGNHTFRQRDFYPMLETEPRVLRPANLSDRAPGRGLVTVTAASADRVAVLNLQGAVFME